MKETYTTAIGMMSGTSMDGIDAVLVRIDKNLKFKVINTHSLDYPQEIKEIVMNAANNKACTKDICFLDFAIGKLFAQCANELVQKSGLDKKKIDYIASHGQTIFHMPQAIEIGGIKTASTLQIGNISVIAYDTGIKTIGDFRSKDIAAGGQGAPLVPFADEIIFGRDIPRAIQNIGGIGNVTVLSPNCETFAFDTGPGNMLIDWFMKKLFDRPYDKDGEIASQGKVDEKWLKNLLKEPYYSVPPPKSTGRELFNDEYAQALYKNSSCNKYDIISTITALTAKTIADAYKNFVFPKTELKEIVLGGGGAYNQTLIRYLKKYLDNKIEIKTHKNYNIDDKFKEAIAFAILGFCTDSKNFNNLPNCTGAKKRVIMGLKACKDSSE